MSGGLEDRWIKQNPQKIEIYDSAKEWDLIQAYITWMKSKDPQYINKQHKISRKDLKTFISKTEPGKKFAQNTNLNEEDINHSFFIFPDQKPGNLKIAVLARSKSYTYLGKEYKEGIMGFGAVGRVNPCRVKDNTNLSGSGEILVIKTLIESCNLFGDTDHEANIGSSKNEVTLLKKLGRQAELLVRDRETMSGYWSSFRLVGQYKTYILQEIAQGEELYINFENNIEKWNQEDKLKVALALAKSLKQLHDKRIVHRDISLRNFIFLTNPSPGPGQDSNFVATVIDLECAKQLEDDQTEFSGKFKGTLGFTAPEIRMFEESVFSLASDIYSLGVVFEKLGINKELYARMIDHERGNRPTIDAVIDKLNASLGLESVKTKSSKLPVFILAPTKPVRPSGSATIQDVPRASQRPPLQEKRPNKPFIPSATENKKEPEFVRKAREMQKKRDDDEQHNKHKRPDQS